MVMAILVLYSNCNNIIYKKALHMVLGPEQLANVALRNY